MVLTGTLLDNLQPGKTPPQNLFHIKSRRRHASTAFYIVREEATMTEIRTNTSIIPIVDFDRWRGGDTVEKTAIARELTDACRRVGFVYIVNHGLPGDLLDEAFSWSKKLFSLPQDKKMLAPHPPGTACNQKTFVVQ
jgi:hypothetical protein